MDDEPKKYMSEEFYRPDPNEPSLFEKAKRFDEIRILMQDCPIGWHGQFLNFDESRGEAAIVDWLAHLYELALNFDEIPMYWKPEDDDNADDKIEPES